MATIMIGIPVLTAFVLLARILLDKKFLEEVQER